jgi:hypothetical protein
MITMIAASQNNALGKNNDLFGTQTILNDSKSYIRTSHHYGKENI